jgi:Fe2+ transport system protein FeoA
MTLDLLKVNETAVVTGYSDNTPIRKQLLAMGLTRNTKVTVVRVAPLGDPIEIKLRSFSLTLRKQDAAQIIIRKV